MLLLIRNKTAEDYDYDLITFLLFKNLLFLNVLYLTQILYI